MLTDVSEYRPSTADRVGIWIFMVAGVGIVGWSVYGAYLQITRAFGQDLPVLVQLSGLGVDAPLGPDGSSVPVTVESATLVIPELTALGRFFAIAETVILLVTILVVVSCLLLLARNTLHGMIFGRTNTRLAAGAGLTGLVGFMLSDFLGQMMSNEALFQVSGGGYDSFALLYTPLPYVLGAFAFGIVLTAYTVGACIQRETDGLV